MKKILYLLPLLIVILACTAQPSPTQDVSNIVSATLTTTVQSNPQVVAPQPTLTPISTQVAPTQPTVPEAWKTFNHGDYTLSYPSAYYIDSTGPVIVITDSKATYDSWHNDSIDSSGLLIQLASLSLDRRLDPNRDPSPLATLEQALQREINRTGGVCYDVSGSTDVHWENANGETYDGRKVFCPSVSYQNTMLGTTSAAKVISDNAVLFFILVPNDDSYYVRITVQPASSVLIEVANQILSTFTFIH